MRDITPIEIKEKIKMTDEEYKQYILEHFHYEDGIITRDDRKNSNGCINEDGYLTLKVKGRKFRAHRIAWLLNYGDFPKSELDHINRNKLDNRIENLRESNRTQQNRNKDFKPNPKTGVIGVYIDEFTKGLKKKYTTSLNKKIYRFYTLEDAINFRKENGLWV